MVVLAYLDAVAFEFICNQWERKRMHTDIYFYVQCRVVPEASVLLSPVGISSKLF
jgi:hypothetical protein